MRRWIVIIGAIILLVGLVLVSSSNAPEKVNNDHTKTVEQGWRISDHFEKGQNLSLNFVPAADWRLPMYLPGEELPYTKIFMVKITNVATNSTTNFEVTIGPPTGITPSPPYSFQLLIYYITVVQHGAITVADEPKDTVGGLIENTGLYEIETSLIPPIVNDKDQDGNLWIHDASPPSQLVLHKTTTETVYPYIYLLPVGTSLGIFGAITSILGIRSQRRKFTGKRLKK